MLIVNQDLHLAIEIFIEGIFDIVHKAAHSVLSPSETFKALFGWLSSHNSGPGDTAGDFDATVSTATLGDDDPTPTETNTTFHQSLNTDARTCRDVITELGYVSSFQQTLSYSSRFPPPPPPPSQHTHTHTHTQLY